MEQGFPHPSTSKIKLITKTKQANADGYKQQLLCFFYTEKRGCCKWAAQEVYNKNMNEIHFCIGSVSHSMHHQSANTKMKMLLNSPSKLNQTPQEFGYKFVAENPDADHADLARGVESFKRAKYIKAREGLPKGIKMNSRGAVLQTLNKYKYSVRSNEEGFDENTVYLCANSKGESYIMDPGNDESEKPFFVAVFTTDELVLNLACQEQSGQDIHVMMDASYCVSNVRKCGYIPMKVATLTQTG